MHCGSDWTYFNQLLLYSLVIEANCFLCPLINFTVDKLVQERELRANAEALATEAERQRQVVALDLKDARQKMDRLKQEYNALVDKVGSCM